ncbi:ABC transporter permease subunit [Nitratireductor sp. CAU 1489]|uniref:ABC transporter permease subunit n=1 Tax=Nitratireductor arenosus TaxID=2682096 RepID=A0A844QAP4_9HYPH|nr:amino acid ABC transporter permease [Nitratireductor arenosus]MVA96252.1 ABC transporter permease subunit [Nitratireductor arenosus]
MNFEIQHLVNNYPLILQGLLVTLRICAASLAIGTVLGLVACFMKLEGRGWPYRFAVAYIDFFRTIPEVVLIFWVYSCLPLLFSFRLTAEASGILALSLFASAYLAEIFRAGINSASRGQVQAALALGIPVRVIWMRIIMPPAIRRMMPALISFLSELIKATSLLSAIGVAEMAYQASVLGSKTFAYVEFLSAIAVLYFVTIFPLSLYVRRTNQKLAGKAGH